ncbi:hypothetical protein, unlikely [Trypanosoma brucei gambiense DAL972]|uniref:Uncharacterized protein n=1 Tax=Trypanosoma brucei gambiense (strain MHOM/CI/86/DAL972) TaxID=679716 RepID=D0A276_TRYB9|nr:hypothetical protein, unlikely [Trypanosoma brucei gambiense DAL972]CBH15370.1 hypothetical protein, unlikely [Trypanosoma brucei gambiense DAL972]|eukprot:XP_011777634.1 hypothetical protein, unlikely [Trypanosoma brucei gambiense DAL972]
MQLCIPPFCFQCVSVSPVRRRLNWLLQNNYEKETTKTFILWIPFLLFLMSFPESLPTLPPLEKKGKQRYTSNRSKSLLRIINNSGGEILLFNSIFQSILPHSHHLLLFSLLYYFKRVHMDPEIHKGRATRFQRVCYFFFYCCYCRCSF